MPDKSMETNKALEIVHAMATAFLELSSFKRDREEVKLALDTVEDLIVNNDCSQIVVPSCCKICPALHIEQHVRQTVTSCQINGRIVRAEELDAMKRPKWCALNLEPHE